MPGAIGAARVSSIVKGRRMRSIIQKPSQQQVRTKICWPASLVVCLLSLPVFGQTAQETNRLVFLIGFYSSLSPDYHAYSIDPERLPSKVWWEAGTEPFPFLLDAEVRRANSFLAQQKQITNRLELQLVQINRTMVRSPDLFEAGNALPITTNEWLVTFEFLEQTEHPTVTESQRAVMLLDGTYATERISRKAAWQSAEPHPHGAAPLPGIQSNAAVPQRHKSAAALNPFDLVRQPGFVVPAVHWSPDGPFPLELNTEVARGYDCLVQTNHMPEGFILQGINILRYTPIEAVRDFLHQRWHWIVESTYGPKPVPEHDKQYRIYTLLDGRILSVTIPEEQAAKE